MPRSAPDGAEVRVFSRSPAPEAAEAAIEPARQSEDGAPQNRGHRAGSACQTTLADRLRGRADPMLSGHSSWSGALDESSVAELYHAAFRPAGSARMTFPCPQTALCAGLRSADRKRFRAASPASAMRTSTGTSVQPRKISRHHIAARRGGFPYQPAAPYRFQFRQRSIPHTSRGSRLVIVRHQFSVERAGHCCILGSCVGSAYMGGQP
jgi:hypothetical protein